MTGLLLLGGGGHCRSSIDVVKEIKGYEIRGIVETERASEKQVLGYPILRFDRDLRAILEEEKSALITVGQVENPENQIRLFSLLKSLKAELPSIVSAFAYVSPHSTVGEGTIVMHGAILNPSAQVGGMHY